MRIIKVDEHNVNEINDLRHGKATVLFFHPGCIHCTMMREPWESMKRKLESQHMEGKIYEVNGSCMDKVQHPIKDQVMGFPTIMSVNNGKFEKHFEKERTMENMMDFVSQSAQPKRKHNNNKSKKKRVRFQNAVNSIRTTMRRLRRKKRTPKNKTQNNGKKQGAPRRRRKNRTSKPTTK